MAKADFYATLGVARDCGAEELKKAYRKLAMQFHPDRNPGDKKAEARFKEVSEAYDILKDDQKRAAYDRFGHAAFEAGAGPGAGGFEGGIGDIFDQMFGEFMGGRRGAQRGPRGGADIRVGVEISLTEAFAGVKRDLRVPTRVACEACAGTGSENRERGAETCSTCAGQGKVRAQQGFFLVERTCPTCGGTGRVVRNPCRICHGAGTVQRERTLTVPIPAGVEDGMKVRLTGEGEAGGPGAPPGDLYVHIAVKPHDIFQREGTNVFCRVPLRMTQAVLGAEIEVPVIDGTMARMKIPPGTNSGDQFRLRGKGFTDTRRTGRGDMHVQVSVEMPQHLSRRQRELLEAFEAEAGTHVGEDTERSSPEHSSFFGKVREFFEGRE
jgi:molecular chaperone DnaJ